MTVKLETYVSKAGRESKILDIRKMDDKETIVVELMRDTPFKNQRYGGSSSYSVLYNGESAYMPIRHYKKSDTKGVPLVDVLDAYDTGALLRITKNIGETKEGRQYSTWKVSDGTKPETPKNLKTKKPIPKLKQKTKTLSDDEILSCVIQHDVFEPDNETLEDIKENVKVLTASNVLEYLKSQETEL